MLKFKSEDISAPSNIQALKEAISKEELIIYPTDTLYGIGGDFLSSEAHRKADVMKGRSDNPYSAAVSSISEAEKLCSPLTDIQKNIMEVILPGKITLLLPVSPSLPSELTRGSKLIGIRIPANIETMKIIKMTQTPIISTSVNFSRQKALNSPEDIEDNFIKKLTDIKPYLMIDKGVPMEPSLGSTIVDISTSPGKIIRKGDDYLIILEKLNSITGWNLL